ncbi:tripartite tricarboxylate transporter TctB family protein (plasmid) [Paracoccus yeei]|uniref:Tripartite tricarboxylate transporter TctB family protein n=1 Tax=Paracoccus yeei TaxID=147645 RepID=A0A1V0GYM1_9RHOB|nr:tripartite tricarboxylate transporter TctB family protein [Paracoccus yeei]ARC38890.1 tripartite tricarboxylate transporter TctB family protein [Paracoccus yeei]
MEIRSPKNFWAGTLYASLGALALLIASRYPMGTGARMGPGFFPTVLAGLLLAFGVASIGQSLLREGSAIESIAWRPLALVIGGVVGFALLLPRIGLPAALVVLILVPATASSAFRLSVRSLGLMVLLIVFSVVLFALLLGVPMPLVGYWLRG